MIPIKSFIKLSSKEKVLVIRTLFWIILVRIMIWILPFSFVQKKVQKITSRYSDNHKSISISRIRFMILIVSRYVPRVTCLVQALSGYILFSKYGYSTKIKIGVLNEDGHFEAHAWVERDKKVILGQSEKSFEPIMDISVK